MKKVLKDLVKLELSLYKSKNDELVNIGQGCLVDCNYFQMSIRAVAGLENALGTLPDEVRRYAQYRYLEQNAGKRGLMAQRFNVSERTISRWDKKLFSCVAIHMGILKKKVDFIEI